MVINTSLLLTLTDNLAIADALKSLVALRYLRFCA